MSDDEEPSRPDETSEFSAFEDEGESRPNDGPRKGDAGADRTEEMPHTAPDDDATQESPRAAPDDGVTQESPRTAVDDGLTQESPRTAPDDDVTQVSPGTAADGGGTRESPRTTAELPAAGGPDRFDRGADAWADDGGGGWSGRAGVRPPRPGYDGYDGYDDDADWAAVSSGEPHGKWWMPILVGMVGLVLLAMLGWGIYLIVQSSGDGTAPPAVTTTAPTAVETTPTTEAPTTPPPTTEPTRSVPPPPADVTVPALKGLSVEEARAALERKLLRYRLRYMTSDSPAGTVIDSDPAEGQQVPPDAIISLIIATAPSESATPTQTASAGPTDQQDGN